MHSHVFLTGGTGYIGNRLIPRLVARGHGVHALVREASAAKLPTVCEVVCGNPLAGDTFAARVLPCDTFVQLVGVPHPSPRKAKEFRGIDLSSGLASVRAAKEAGVKHFVYVSVAHPAPVMRDHIAVRIEVEEAIRASGMDATILRPWYVLGPGHRWPYVLLPAYWLVELIPAKRESARRLGLVTLEQMISALANAVDTPARGIKVVEVPEIRVAGKS